jgi:hypothetical protein
VLTVEENGDHWLWNPVSGEHMTTRETFCPLESVYAIANESEILISKLQLLRNRILIPVPL